MNNTKTYLDSFGKFIVQQSKSNLSKKRKRDTSELYNSISYDLKVSKNSFQLSFSMADYGKFVDLGVQGFKSSFKAPNSPFKFGTGTGISGGLTKGIDGWVRRKRIQFKNRGNGQFMSYEQTAFLVRNSVWNKGITTTNFFQRPFELAFKKLPDDLVKAYDLELEDLLKHSLK